MYSTPNDMPPEGHRPPSRLDRVWVALTFLPQAGGGVYLVGVWLGVW